MQVKRSVANVQVSTKVEMDVISVVAAFLLDIVIRVSDFCTVATNVNIE